MGFRLRCNIAKGGNKVILIDDVGGNFFANNFAENGFCGPGGLLKKYCGL